MTGSAGVATAVAALLMAWCAQAQSAPPSPAIAAMYAEANRLGVSAEEAERALGETAENVRRQDVVAGLEGLVGSWPGSVAAGASARPAKAELRR